MQTICTIDLRTLSCNLHKTPESTPVLQQHLMPSVAKTFQATCLHLQRISAGNPSSGCGYISGRSSWGVTSNSTALQKPKTLPSGNPLAPQLLIVWALLSPIRCAIKAAEYFLIMVFISIAKILNTLFSISK